MMPTPANNDTPGVLPVCAGALANANSLEIKQVAALCAGLLVNHVGLADMRHTMRMLAQDGSPAILTREFAKDVIKEVADKRGLTYQDMLGPRRAKRVAWPRQEAYAEVRERCPHLSLPAIGKLFGDRDHTTIIHGINAHARRMALAAE